MDKESSLPYLDILIGYINITIKKLKGHSSEEDS